jgi:hypothetical protein
MRLLIASLLVLAAGSASAQTKSQPGPEPMQDISGKWVFQTILVQKGCKIEGDMMFKRQGKQDNYTCSFGATETCGKGADQTFTKVTQTCTAKAKNGGFEILSKIVAMVDAGPKELRESMIAAMNYSPDNFTVRPLSETVMAGQFFSRNVAAVRFERVIERVS